MGGMATDVAQTLVAAANRAVTQLWAAAPPGSSDPLAHRDPEWGKAAPAGILVWIFLGVALFLLIKSMNKHLRRIPKNAQGRADNSLIASEHGWVPRPSRKRPADSGGSAGAAGDQAADSGTVSDSSAIAVDDVIPDKNPPSAP